MTNTLASPHESNLKLHAFLHVFSPPSSSNTHPLYPSPSPPPFRYSTTLLRLLSFSNHFYIAHHSPNLANKTLAMADHRRHQQHYGGDQQTQHYYGGDVDQRSQYSSDAKSILPQHGPSASQVIAVITLVPLGGTLLLLAGLTLAGTFIGMALSTPLFVIFSPILVPAIITVALAVAGILSSGAFGITGLSSFSWLANYLRRTTQKAKDLGQTVSEKAQEAGQAIQDKAHETGQKVQETGQNIQSKAQEAGHKAQDTGRTHEGGKARDVKVT